MLAHEIIARPTQDVDLFTDQEHGVQAAAAAVQEALDAAGFEVERDDQDGDLADLFPAWANSWPSGLSPVPTGRN